MMPGLSQTSPRESKVDAAIAEYLIARQDGQSFDRTAWLAQHADVADELRDFLADEDHVGGMLAPLQQEHSTPGPANLTDPNITRTHGGSEDTATITPRIERLGDYEIIDEIARGGMGVVFKARQKSLNRVVALKMVLGNRLASKKDIERFQREAEAAAGLDHPNIVPIYEVGAIEGLPFFSMKLIEGGSLTQDRKPLTDNPRRIAALMAKVARAVHHAHQRGILHRDLKPSNVLLDANGEPHVADFGLAKRIEDASNPDADNTQTGAVVGTPSYMAPEQARGEIKQLTTAADVYGLGAVLYDLLTDQPPFRANSPAETLLLVLNKEAKRPSQLHSNVPRDLETICLKCLEKEPGKRYASAEALAQDLDRWLQHEPIEARPAGPTERLTKWVRRNKSATAVIAVSLIALGAIALAQLLSKREISSALEAKTSALDKLNKQQQITSDALTDLKKSQTKEQRTGYVRGLFLAQHEWLANRPGRCLQILNELPAEFRGWEWHYLQRQCKNSVLSLHWDNAPVNCVAFNNDATLFAMANGNLDSPKEFAAQIRICEFETGREVALLRGHTGSVFNVCFSPDGKTLASCSRDKTVRIWDWQKRLELKSLVHKADALDAFYDQSGQRLVTADGGGNVHLWNIANWEEILSIKVDDHYYFATALSRDGNTIATGGRSNTIQLWDAKTGERKKTLEGHSDVIYHLAFVSDGKRLASCGRDGTIRIWSMTNGKTTKLLKQPSGEVHRIRFLPDGNQLIAAGGNSYTGLTIGAGDVILWNIHNGQIVDQYRGIPSTATGLALTADGKFLGANGRDGTYKLWNLNEAGEAKRIAFDSTVSRQPRRLRIGPDENWVSVSLFNMAGQNTSFWNLSSSKPAEQFPQTTRGAIHPDGKRWIIPSGRTEKADTLQIYDRETGVKLAEIGKDIQHLTDVIVSPNGRFVAVAHLRWMAKFRPDWKAIRIYDLETGNLLWELPDSQTVSELAFTRDSSHLVSAGNAGKIQLWNLNTGEHVRALEAPGGTVHAIALRPDDRTLASAGADGIIRIWDLQSGELIQELKGHTGAVFGLAYNQDASRLASGGEDATLRLWDPEIAQEVLTIRSHRSAVTGVAFNRDGTQMVSCSNDGYLSVWNSTPLTLQSK